MLFKGEKQVFTNIDDIFIYTPNNRIRSVAFYFTESGWVKEYDYEFATNNLGLVQNTDISEHKPSLLILGDSFTEGQGAIPWFRKLEPEIQKMGLQPVNGGLLGTGFQQFLRLHDYIRSANVTVTKVIVIFISDDYRRKIWNFPDNILRCMNDYRACAGSESFYQLPPENEVGAFLDRLIASRSSSRKIKEKIKNYFPATRFAYAYAKDYMRPLIGKLLFVPKEKWRIPIQTLVQTYGTENVLFVHIPQKQEVLPGPNLGGKLARSVISENNATLFDGFKHCGLTVSDYREIDNHPNEVGYDKIFKCVRQALVPFVSAGRVER